MVFSGSAAIAGITPPAKNPMTIAAHSSPVSALLQLCMFSFLPTAANGSPFDSEFRFRAFSLIRKLQQAFQKRFVFILPETAGRDGWLTFQADSVTASSSF
jgi:hypothetical protein